MIASCPILEKFPAAMHRGEDHCDLDDVIATGLLDQRNTEAPNLEKETALTLKLLEQLAKNPENLFSKLVDAVMELSHAQSAGISLLDEPHKEFIWPAVVGGLSSYVGAGTPSDYGPCGVVMERDIPILFVHPERYFAYLKPIRPSLEEVLLVPFYMNDEPVGTLWAVIHEPGRHFDSEDRRLLKNLSAFAASAYRVLTQTGALKRILDELPRPQTKRRLINEDGNWRFIDD